MKSSQVISDALSEWREVQNAADLCHETFHLLDDDEVRRLAERAHCEDIRAALRRRVNGVPVYANVETVDARTGKTTRQYKQTEMFTVADYKAAVSSYVRRAKAEMVVAQALRDDCAARLGVQLELAATA